MTYKSNKKIVVTGATGFLGSRVVDTLAGKYDVIAAGRTLDPTYPLSHNNVTYKLGDLTDLDYCREIVQGCSHVVNCAGLSTPWGNYDSFFKANVLTQVNLLTACAEANIQRFIYISTSSMYFNYRDRFNVSEADPLPGTLVNHYAATKRVAERVLEESGQEYIILRPRAIIGRGDRYILPRLIRTYEEGRLRMIGDGTNVMDLTAVSNVARAVELSVQASPEHCGHVYNVTNGNPVKVWFAINYVLFNLGLEPIQRKVPYQLALIGAKSAQWWAEHMNKWRKNAFVPYSVATLARSMTLDISKIRTRLGFQPEQSTYDAIDEFIEWYLGQREARGYAA